MKHFRQINTGKFTKTCTHEITSASFHVICKTFHDVKSMEQTWNKCVTNVKIMEIL